jgi:hypothetical protein
MSSHTMCIELDEFVLGTLVNLRRASDAAFESLNQFHGNDESYSAFLNRNTFFGRR